MDETIHAGCVILGEAGVLIRGRAGSGKSNLARELVLHGRCRNLFSCLVSDDRTRIGPRHGRVVAWPVQAIAGHIEIRGTGIVRQPFESAVVLRLVIDLTPDEPERYPEKADATVPLCGVMLPRLRAKRGAPLADIVLGRLSGGDYDPVVTL
jgi:HPr kinase/phosphorylase